jgi:hypothetical protein
MKENTHVRAIPQDVLNQAQAKIQEVLTLLTPYILTLTPAERQGMPQKGEKTIGFVEKAYDFVQQNPNLTPLYLEMAVFEADLLMPASFGLFVTWFCNWRKVSAIRK